MRKAGLSAVVVCVLALLWAGCGANQPPRDPVPSPGASDGVAADLPPAVAATVETLRPMHAGMALVDGDDTYIIAGYGGRPGTGYEAEITDIQTEGDRAVVTVGLTTPDPGADGQDIVTYPCVVEILDGAYTDVQFQDRDDAYFPRVVGLDKPLQLIGRSDSILVSSLVSAGGRIHAGGLARVFEATVSYELLDANGTVLHRGFTTAAAGGPDWGYFEITIEDPPQEAVSLLFFQASARDGSKMDVVELPVVQGCG